ncbi:MAG: hypothetical protein FWG55_02800 [Candidatus Bathyarchaeota archaeon]|nr:hypothetical protein [Candidatus Termiticorpusculum sp.]
MKTKLDGFTIKNVKPAQSIISNPLAPIIVVINFFWLILTRVSNRLKAKTVAMLSATFIPIIILDDNPIAVINGTSPTPKENTPVQWIKQIMNYRNLAVAVSRPIGV